MAASSAALLFGPCEAKEPFRFMNCPVQLVDGRPLCLGGVTLDDAKAALENQHRFEASQIENPAFRKPSA